MAYTTPNTSFATGNIVVASDMNAINNNIAYLHGDAGAITLANDLTAGSASAAAIVASASGSSSSARLALVCKQAGVAVEYRNLVNGLGTGEWLLFDNVAGATRLRVESSGFFGVGASAPKAPFHVNGAGGVASSGILFSSVAAVTSLQTAFPAGTVTRAALLFVTDRNNTGGAITGPAATTLLPGGAVLSYANTDTINIAVTAGGAITAQRTSGTNGTHDIVIFAMVQ